MSPAASIDLRVALLVSVSIVAILFMDTIFMDKNILPYSSNGYGANSHDPWGAELNNKTVMVTRNLLGQGLPYWDPTEAAGKPVIGDPHYKILNPLQWLAMIHPTPHVMTALLLIKLIISGVCMFLFLRTIALQRVAAAFGVLAWLGNGYVTGYMTHNHFDVFFLLPVTMLAVQMVFEPRQRKGGTVLLSVVVWLNLVGGNPQSTVLSMTLAGLFLFTMAWVHYRRGNDPSGVWYGVLAYIIGLLFAFPDLWATFQYHDFWAPRRDGYWRAEAPAIEMTYRWLFPRADNFLNVTNEGLPTFGFLASVAMLYCLPLLVRKAETTFFVIAVGFTIYYLGEHLIFEEAPLKKMFLVTPLITELRFIKYLDALFFSLSVLFAASINCLFPNGQSSNTNRRPILIWVGCVYILIVVIVVDAGYGLLGLDLKLAPGKTVLDEKRVILYLVVATIAGAFYAGFLSGARVKSSLYAALAVLGLIAVVEYVQVNKSIFNRPWTRHDVAATVPSYNQPSEIVRFLLQDKQSAQPFRVVAADNNYKPVLDNIHGVHLMMGGNALHVGWYYEFVAKLFPGIRLEPPRNLFDRSTASAAMASPMLDALNVRYVITNDANTESMPNHFRLVGEFQKDVSPWSRDVALYLYENERVAPRAFLVDSWHSVEHYRESIDDYIQNPQLFLREAQVYGGDPVPAASQSPTELEYELEFTSYENDAVEMKVTNNKLAMLVLTDVYAPGWEVMVDGARGMVYHVNGAFRGVVLPAGEHTVRFFYRPDVLGWPLGVAIAGVLILLVFLIVARAGDRPAQLKPSA